MLKDTTLKESIYKRIREYLSHKREAILAYVFGSFLESDSFKDMDIALLLDAKIVGASEFPFPKFALKLASELERSVAPPRLDFDLKILNLTPIYFQYEVVKKGTLVFSRSEVESVQCEVRMISEYLDYKPTLEWFNNMLLSRISQW